MPFQPLPTAEDCSDCPLPHAFYSTVIPIAFETPGHAEPNVGKLLGRREFQRFACRARKRMLFITIAFCAQIYLDAVRYFRVLAHPTLEPSLLKRIPLAIYRSAP